MSSISVRELISLLQNCDPDSEVVMKIRHKYPISKEEGERGWISYINGFNEDKDFREVQLLN